MQELYKCFGKGMSLDEECGINQVNFSPNMRPYDVTASGALLLNPSPTAYYTPMSPATATLFTNLPSDDQVIVNDIFAASYNSPLPAYSSVLCNNTHTAMGMPHFWENNYVGKSLYAMQVCNWQDDMTIRGRNTTLQRPFNLTLRTNLIAQPPANNFERPCTMYFMMFYDLLVELRPGQVNVYGRT